MPLVLADRVRDTTTTTGTGTVTLSGTAPTGYQSFAVIGNGNTTYYTINAGSQWEVGIGTYSSTGPTLARNTVLESSNSNALVDFAAGTKDVFVTYPADEAVYQDGATIAAGTAVLGVANGGTGVTTSTGTSSVVLSNSPTLVTPTLGAASATSIAAGLGAVGTPSYTFTGDLNTGIYSPAADTLAFVEGGVEAMRIDSAGNVGIGTASPAGRLTVASATGNTGFNTGTSSSPERGNLWYDTDGTGWKFNIGKLQSGAFTAQMTFQDNGNVGIGTSSPGTRLHVQDTEATVRLTATSGRIWDLVSGGGGNAGANFFTIRDTSSGANVVSVAPQASEAMRIDSSGNVGIGTTSPTRRLSVAGTTNAYMDFSASSFRRYTIGSESVGFALFDDTASAYRMVVNSSGNVGIGTTAPNANLQIVSANTVVARLTTTGAATQAELSFGTVGGSGTVSLDQSGNWVARTQQSSMFIDNFGAAGSIIFRTGGANERMRIDNAGNVGIGTSAPERRLHVVSNQPLRMGTLTDWFQFTQTNTNVWGWLSSSSVYPLTMNGATGAVSIATTTPDAAAQLQVDSTTRGFLPPRMTTTQRDAISSPPNGLVLYNNTTNKLQVRAAGAWVDLH